MKKKGILTIFTSVALIFSLLISNSAFAETGTASVLGADLVDSGGHMDYTLNTNYSTYVSGCASVWNSYLGNTVIRKDGATTIADVDIYDVSEPDETWCGLTIGIGESIAGAMQLNTHYLCNFTYNYINNVIEHEFGHTLGCDENDCYTSNVMFSSVRGNYTLTVHDKASVDLAKKSW